MGPNFEVPSQPGVESAPTAVPEKVPNKETPGGGGPAQAPPQTDDAQSIAAPAQNVQVGDPQTAPVSTQTTKAGPKADDADLIEKQWVDKAKLIVEKTKNDPYVQNKELSKVKAEYVSKRFDKDLKLSEDKAV